MPELTCLMAGCDWKYSCEFSNEQSQIEMIKLHCTLIHPSSDPATSQSNQCKAPKLNRPTIDMGVDQEQWDMFMVRWKQFASGVQLSAENAPLQLLECASESLSSLMLKFDPLIATRPVDEVLSTMESHAVIRVSRGFQRAELMKMSQGNDEAVRTFAARVKGKARTCGFVVVGKCACQKSVSIDYTQEVIKDVLLAGISDTEIQTSVVEMDEIEKYPPNEIIAIIERKERARKAYRTTNVSGLSEFKRKQTHNAPTQPVGAKTPNRAKRIPCPDCKRFFNPFHGKNTAPYRNCYNCYKGPRQKNKQSNAIIE